MNENVILKTERLIIRSFNLEDTDQVFKLSQEKGIKKWLPDQVYKDEKETKNVLKYLISRYQYISDIKKAPYVFAVEINSTKTLIGHIGLSLVDLDLEIGYGISDKYQNKGYATELVNNFTEWSVDKFNLDKIWGIVDEKNYASIKVLEKSNYSLNKKKNKKLYFMYNK